MFYTDFHYFNPVRELNHFKYTACKSLQNINVKPIFIATTTECFDCTTTSKYSIKNIIIKKAFTKKIVKWIYTVQCTVLQKKGNQICLKGQYHKKY